MTVAEEDALIGEALLDANAIDFASIISNKQPVAVSKRFQREMDAMAKDPNKWVRRHRRPLWKQILQTAAMIILVGSLSLGALMAVSPTVRAAVVSWVTELYETYIIYRFPNEPAGDVTTQMPKYEITDLPEGYYADGDILEFPNDSERKYVNEAGDVIRFEWLRMHPGRAYMIETDNMIVSERIVNGSPAKLYSSTNANQSNVVLWMDEDAGMQFIIDGFVDEKVLLHMSESVSLCSSTK